MSFPTLVATSHGSDQSPGALWTVNVPAGNTGDLIVLLVVNDGDSTPTIPGYTTLLTADSGTGDQLNLTVAYRQSTALPSTPEVITINAGASDTASYIVYRYSGWNSITGGASFSSISSAPQPPSHSTSNANNVWITVAGWVGARTVSAYPYASNQITDGWNNASGSSLAASTKQLAASSDTPGSFTLSSNSQWVTATIAIGDAPSISITEQPDRVASAARDNPDACIFNGAYFAPWWNVHEYRDVPTFSATVNPEFTVSEQADTPTFSGFAFSMSNEQADQSTFSGLVTTTCTIVKVWRAGEWVRGVPKIYQGGSWNNIPGVKVWDGSAWDGC